MALANRRLATMHNGTTMAGPSIGELLEGLADYIDGHFIVENIITKQKHVGGLGECMSHTLEWKRAGQEYTITKVNKEVAQTLYGKKL